MRCVHGYWNGGPCPLGMCRRHDNGDDYDEEKEDTMIYIKESGVTVEDTTVTYATGLALEAYNGPFMNSESLMVSEEQAETLLRGLLRWKREKTDSFESNDAAAMYETITTLLALMEKGR